MSVNYPPSEANFAMQMHVATRPTAAAATGTRRIGFFRVLELELRKLVDTTAAKVLGAAVVVLTIGNIVLSSLGGSSLPATYPGLLTVISGPLLFLLPVIGALLVTSEWSQRSVTNTFTLVPRRGLVVAAKVVSAVLMGLVAALVASGIVAARILAGHGQWTDPDTGATALAATGGVTLWAVVSVLLTVGFGLLWRNSAVAIVTYFAVPLALTALRYVVQDKPTVMASVDWIDWNTHIDALTSGLMSSTAWAQFGVASALWVGLPLLAGTIGVLRRDET